MFCISKIYKTNKCGELRIINRIDSVKVEVEFLSTGYRRFASVGSIVRGEVRDLLHRSVVGVGFFGIGPYKGRKNGKTTAAYSIWYGMILRCYSEKSFKESPSYRDCTVCPEWHNFQVFAKWFYGNYIDGYQLDKDIRISGNREYSPEACSFVTAKENSIASNAKHYRFISPKGDLVEIYNLNEFALKKGLAPSSMFCVHYGRMSNHKGWSKAAF